MPERWLTIAFRTERRRLGDFLANLCDRIVFVNAYAKASHSGSRLWLGGFFSPPGFLTFFRQTTARSQVRRTTKFFERI